MDKIFLIQHDSNSGEKLSEIEVTMSEGVYQAWKKNDALYSVGYSPEYSLWVREAAGRYEYRIDIDTEREV